MVRAAQPMPAENENFAPVDNSQEPTVLTTLRSSTAPEDGAGVQQQQLGTAAGCLDSVSAVTQAFLSNLSGGAACFDVDLQMIADDALTEQLLEAFDSVRSEMAFADVAAWRVGPLPNRRRSWWPRRRQGVALTAAR